MPLPSTQNVIPVSEHDQHSSFIKTPKQLIAVIVLAFAVPVTAGEREDQPEEQRSDGGNERNGRGHDGSVWLTVMVRAPILT